MESSIAQSTGTAHASVVVSPLTLVAAPVRHDDCRECSDIQLPSSLGNQLNMVHAKLGSVASLYVALRAKHGPAALHSLRVAMCASAWGVHSRLPEDQLQLLEIAGLLHEIGKIGIPDRVLQKPERLNENEQAMMELHTQVGLEILRSAGASSPLLLAIQGIGVHFDGSNENNATDSVPVVSRMINIIDAFDSMTTQQVFRNPLDRETALAEIYRLGGTQFDPGLVHAFAKMMLNPKTNIMELTQGRWIAELESKSTVRFFDLENQKTQGPSSHSERPSSALIQTLNDSFYRHMMDHLQDGVIFIDSEYRVLDWNGAAERMTGKSVESVFQQRWNPSFAALCNTDGLSLPESECPFHALMETGEKIERRMIIGREGFPVVHVNLEVVPVFNDRGHLCGGAMILEDVSETAVLEQKIVHLRERASQDQLTKVPNRGELNRQLPEFVDHHLRIKHPGSLIICDIDFFKRINDTYSHQAGDEALIAFASLLKDSCRDTDFVARYGGEEFVMLCGECDFSEAKEVAENIRKRLSRTPIPALRNACMTASFGVSTILPGDTPETVLGRADQGLLIAKESGRDRVVGLGLETKSAPESASVPATGSWLRWLTSGKPTALKYELMTNVPRNVTLEKLKGFINEVKAEVIDVQENSLEIDIDCRKAKIPQTKNERLGKFRMKITLSELEVKASKRTQEVKICTHLETEFSLVYGRDRRAETITSQALRLKAAFQVLVVAIDVDESVQESIIRKIKPETDSRY